MGVNQISHKLLHAINQFKTTKDLFWHITNIDAGIYSNTRWILAHSSNMFMPSRLLLSNGNKMAIFLLLEATGIQKYLPLLGIFSGSI